MTRKYDLSAARDKLALPETPAEREKRLFKQRRERFESFEGACRRQDPLPVAFLSLDAGLDHSDFHVLMRAAHGLGLTKINPITDPTIHDPTADTVSLDCNPESAAGQRLFEEWLGRLYERQEAFVRDSVRAAVHEHLQYGLWPGQRSEPTAAEKTYLESLTDEQKQALRSK